MPGVLRLPPPEVFPPAHEPRLPSNVCAVDGCDSPRAPFVRRIGTFGEMRGGRRWCRVHSTLYDADRRAEVREGKLAAIIDIRTRERIA